MRLLLVVAVLVSLCSCGLTLKPLQPLGFDEVNKATYTAAKTEFDRKLKEQSVSFASITEEQEETVKPSQHQHYSKHQQKLISEAKLVDQTLYGGKTFVPPPGHDMHFDFETFGRFAEINTAIMSRKIKKISKRSHVWSKTEGLITSDFFQACIELTLCTSPPPTTKGACVQMGFDGIVTLETKEGKQTLTIGAGAQAGVAFKLAGPVAFSIYLQGNIEWEFEITGQKKDFYISAFDALCGAIKYWMAKSGEKKMTLHSTLISTALDARKAAAAQVEASDTSLTMPQPDELAGLVGLHYKYMRQVHELVRTSTTLTAQNFQRVLAEAWIIALWQPKNTTASLSEDMCRCTRLNEARTDRKDGRPLGIYAQLMCNVLTYAPLIPENQKKYARVDFAWRTQIGTDHNFKAGLAVLYREIWPTTDADVPKIKDLLQQFAEAYDAVPAADWGKTTSKTAQVEDPETKKVASMTTVYKAASVVKVDGLDPTTEARELYQALASSSTDLTSVTFNTPSSLPVQFNGVSVKVTGTVGVTLGGSAMGYCTEDTNVFQMQLRYARTWDRVTGKWRGGWFEDSPLTLWAKFKPGKIPIWIELEGIISGQSTDDTSLKVAVVYGYAPEGGGLSKTIEPYVNIGKYAAIGLGQILTMFQGAGGFTAGISQMSDAIEQFFKSPRFTAITTSMPDGSQAPAGFMDSFVGKLLSVGVGGLVNYLAADLFGATAVNKTIMEVSLELSCTGVTNILHCLPKVGAQAKYMINVGLALVRTKGLGFGGNTFYVSTGNSFNYEAQLSGPPVEQEGEPAFILLPRNSTEL